MATVVNIALDTGEIDFTAVNGDTYLVGSSQSQTLAARLADTLTNSSLTTAALTNASRATATVTNVTKN